MSNVEKNRTSLTLRDKEQLSVILFGSSVDDAKNGDKCAEVQLVDDC